MYYPIGWPKKLKFQFKDLSVISGTSENIDQKHGPQNQMDDEGKKSDGDAENGCTFTSSGEETDTGSCERRMLQIAANSDRTLFAVLTPRSLHVWFSRPSVEIVCHWRSSESIDVLGCNSSVFWKPDSTAIVIKTTRDILIFYRVAFRDDLQSVLEQSDNSHSGTRKESVEFVIPDKIPSLYLLMSFSTEVAPGISSILAAEEEVVVATKNGEIIGINWDGTLDPNFRWDVSDGTDGFIIRDIKYSSMIGGFSLVFMNGKVAFMPIHYHPDEGGVHNTNGNSNSSNNNTNTSTAQSSTGSGNGSKSATKIMQRRPSLPNVSSRVLFVADVENGVTSSINHKYQIIAFGLRNSEGIICCIDEEHSVVMVTHRIILPANTFPETSVHSIGSMCCLQWSPDSMVLATAWQKGGIALWSVFGALLMCSLSWDFGFVDRFSPNLFVVSSIAWSREGYQLWLISEEAKRDSKTSNSSLMQMSMAKSMLASNPSAICCCRESLLLLTEDRLYLGVGTSSNSESAAFKKSSEQKGSQTQSSDPSKNSKDDEEILPSTNLTSCKMEYRQQTVEVGNQQWIVIQIPFSYLSTNWPVRLASVDKSGQSIAIAGRSGFAHYSILTRKWKLFGNESQEKDFEVCGGIVYYEQFVILSCYNIPDSSFEIRSYPARGRLDNNSMKIFRVSSEILVMSIHGNQLLTMESDGTISLFAFTFPAPRRRESTSSASSLNPNSMSLIHLSQISISNLVIPPECVISIFLTSLHLETSANGSDSILLNVCGRVFLLEKEYIIADVTGGEIPTTAYKAVSILASGVENIWVSPKDSTFLNSDRPHLTDALWLSRGCNGMNVWLPLLPSLSEKSSPQSSAHNFMSKRIMLPINTHIYPLAVLFRDAVVIGAENDTLHWGKNCPVTLPYSTISRTSQVYLHHILRELLKKNLGMHAWDIANTCTDLPHFPHSLELLLHETLEEEATSSQPIPDALLPRVVNFIREFPVFLETIVHCARKTELALWPHLFSVVGNPKDLFQSCLDKDLLETAASYLLILQNLERTSVSRKYATMLLDSARKKSKKQLANDLSRFLDSIDPLDFECPPPKPSTSSLPPGASNVHSVKYHSVSVSSVDGEQHPTVGQRKRTSSSSASLMIHSPPLSSSSSSPFNNFSMQQLQQSTNTLTTTTSCQPDTNSSQVLSAPGRSLSLSTRKILTDGHKIQSTLKRASPPVAPTSASMDTSISGNIPKGQINRSVSEPGTGKRNVKTNSLSHNSPSSDTGNSNAPVEVLTNGSTSNFDPQAASSTSSDKSAEHLDPLPRIKKQHEHLNHTLPNGSAIRAAVGKANPDDASSASQCKIS